MDKKHSQSNYQRPHPIDTYNTILQSGRDSTESAARW